jgi:hypothetical protein
MQHYIHFLRRIGNAFAVNAYIGGAGIGGLPQYCRFPVDRYPSGGYQLFSRAAGRNPSAGKNLL